MKNIINILKKSKGVTDKKHKGEIDQLSSKLREVEYENKTLQTQLREKEKVC